MIDVFLIHDDPERSAAIKSAIARYGDLSMVSATAKGRDGLFAVSTILQGHPRMAVVRLALGDMNGFDLITQIRQKASDVYVVPVLEGNEGGQVWQRLLQMELKDVIVGPVDQEEIAKVLASAAVHAQSLFESVQAARGPSGEAFMISVVAARGGTGKSTIATNLAALMAKSLPKAESNVALVDFSLNAGDFAVMLDDVPRNNILEAVSAGGNLDSELLQGLLATHPKLGFRYLASPNQEFDSMGFDYNVGAALLQAIKGICQFVVVDTGAASSGPTAAAIDTSDLIFLVTSRDVARMLSSQRLLKYLKNERNVPASKLKVLVNQAEVGAEIAEKEIESLLDHPVTAYLPSNPNPVTFAINSGHPVGIAEPQHPISMVFGKLATLCLNRWHEPPASQSASASSAISKLTSTMSKISQKLTLHHSS